MILIVTLNPLLERRFTHYKIEYGKVNRNCKLNLEAGGKGVNVSRQLKNFGLNSFNYFFAGGNNGKLYREILKKQGLEFSFINTNSETREAAVSISVGDKKVTSLFSSDPMILKSEVNEFKAKLEKMIQNCEIVIFSGSSPSENCDSIIPLGIEIANRYDKISICDTYGKNLIECFNAQPTIVHNNFHEIESSLGLILNTEESILNLLDRLYKLGIKRAYITNGAKDFYASNFNYVYKIKPPAINYFDSTGSGDTFVAALTYRWLQSDVFEESLKFATAAASLNASRDDVSNVKLEDVLLVKNNVNISSVGKKMKIIDDSPHEI